MLRMMLKSKIHRAAVTQADLNYEGSITIDKNLLKAANIYPGEKVHVVNINNGSRFETYAVNGSPGSGEICLNGAAARLGHIGDLVIIMSYALYSEEEMKSYKPFVIKVDKSNKMKS